MDEEVIRSKRAEMEQLLARLYQLAPTGQRFEPFYQSTMHAIFWLEDALKSLPKLPPR